MNNEILQKLKKVLRILFLIIVGLILFFIILTIYFFATQGGATRQKTFSSPPSAFPTYLSEGFVESFGTGVSNGINVTLPDMPSGGEEDILNYGNDVASLEAPTPTIPASERKLIQNGALSLVVERVEEAVTNLASIATKFGGRIGSANIDNRGGTEKKQATVVMRVPAVNFGAAMEQVKGIARKVVSENISTEDITEKFIDMQARLKNLKAEEAQYLDIMQKAVKIDDVLKVSQRLYMVRQQIEQLQGQMNYLSRQVDMSVITIELSSESDIKPVSDNVWSPGTTVKEAMKGLIDGFYTFLKFAILFVGYLLPLLILWGAVAVLAVWLMWKLIVAIKKQIHKL